MDPDPPSARPPALARLLQHPRAPWLALALVVLIGLPSLGGGLFADDWGHRALVLRWQARGLGSWWDLFSFYPLDPVHTTGMRTSGRYPWWTDPELHITFFRPLAAASHQLDYWLWPQRPWLMHLHSLAWHLGCCALAWQLARRLASSARVATIAALIYGLSFTHVIAWSWLAHRNGLISTFWALAALLAHIHWRERGSRVAALAAPLALGAALLAAEAGVAALGFLLAYELLAAPGPSRPVRRALALLPALASVLAWRLLYTALGHGASRSGSYIDPLAEPAAFTAALPRRLVSLLTLSVSPPFFPELEGARLGAWFALAGAIALALLAFAWRSRAGAARFGLLACALACVPLAASFPVERVLVLASFGASLALAELLEAWGLRGRAALERGAAALVVLVHLLAPIPAALLISTSLERVIGLQELEDHGAALPNEGLAKRNLIIIHAPHLAAVHQLKTSRAARGLELPNFTWVLHAGVEQPRLRCVGDRSVELDAPRLGWPSGADGLVFRSVTARPFVLGESVRTLEHQATVLAVEGGRASSVRFDFRAVFEHPNMLWATWVEGQLVPVDPRELCE